MNPVQPWHKNRLDSIVLFIFLLNLLILDLFLITDKLNKNNLQSTNSTAASTSQAGSTQFQDGYQDVTADCSPSCLSEISKAVAHLKQTPSPTKTTVKNLPGSLPTSLPNFPSSQSLANQNTVKEFFVPLGSGSVSATDWTDVPGVQAEIDSSKYGGVQKVLFEASTHVSDHDQIVEVRLYNNSDNYAIDNSSFLYPSATTQNFRIAEIRLVSGKKTYQVQMKTQLGYSASLDQARIHITTE